MKKLILTIFLITNILQLNAQCTQFDIMLLVDKSSSIEDHNMKYIGDALNTFVNKFELSENTVRIGIYSFNNLTTLHTGLTTDITFLNDICKVISTTDPVGQTNMGGAISFAITELINNGRANVPKFVILITDGKPSGGNDLTAKQADRLKSIEGTFLCGIFVDTSTGDDLDIIKNLQISGGRAYLRSISSEGFYYNTNYEGLAKQLEQISMCF